MEVWDISCGNLAQVGTSGGVDLYTGGIGSWALTTANIVSGTYTDIAYDNNDVYVGVPEPATLALLGLGSLMLVVRKR